MAKLLYIYIYNLELMNIIREKAFKDKIIT